MEKLLKEHTGCMDQREGWWVGKERWPSAKMHAQACYFVEVTQAALPAAVSQTHCRVTL